MFGYIKHIIDDFIDQGCYKMAIKIWNDWQVSSQLL